MNRASTTNGHPTTSALAQGGYNAYFAQVEQSADEGVGANVTGAAPAEQVEHGSAAASVQPPRESAPPPQGAGGPPSPPAPPVPPPVPPQTSATPGPGSTATVSDVGAQREGPAQGPTAGPGYGAGASGGAAPTSSTDRFGQWADPAATAASAERQQAHSAAAPGQERPAATGDRFTHAGGQGASNVDTSRVPDRIARYDHRISVLPPALASPELLADIAAVRQAHLQSSSGVRGALNKVGFSFGLSPIEQRAEDRRNRIRRPLTTPYQIAVVSVKGGVGRTTTAAALGSTFAKLRPDRVAAVDANPDFGDLSTRTVRHPYGLTLRDLATAAHPLDSFSAVHAYTAVNAADLAVIASPWTSDASDALSGDEYATGVETLRRHYNLLLVDCGTGVLDSVTDTVLRTSDAVLVVTPATVGGVTGAVATLNWLSSHGFDHLIATSVVAIVHHHPVKPTVDVAAIEKLFASAQRPTCRLPFDTHLAEGGEVDLRLLDKETVLAFEELAAGLADDFPRYEVGPAGAGGRL
ncbi:MinD/ParA family ATP-binding protein [Nocardia sp. NBC_01329]|uniref:MinD/ParA family ATP-binding protein n=1 Tax=Nocardia sp. NBC_01329 TaxID=2903594 RepID=UPI002E1184FF|nr:MinD/ParA family protein [Nocardia sp. NBC_01329]